jgi:solute carrier family 50 protein (sugar transporter)
MQIPNGCGSFLGAVQLILYAIYRNSSGGSNKAGAAATRRGGKQRGAGDDDDVEMAAAFDTKSGNKVAHDVGGGAGNEERLV